MLKNTLKAYNKEKRTFEALQELIKSNDEELQYLDAVLTSVNNCVDEQDVKEIRKELRDNGYIKKTSKDNSKQSSKKSKPLPLPFFWWLWHFSRKKQLPKTMI